MVYGIGPSPGFEPQKFEYLVAEVANHDDDHAEVAPSQDHLKDEDKELKETNLAGEGEEAQLVFLSASLIGESNKCSLTS